MTTLALNDPISSDIASVESLRTIRVGLAGCGVVGGALVRLLHDSADTIAARHGVRFELSRVLVRDVTRDRGVPLTQTVFTNDAESFNAHDVDVIVEAIGGEDTASKIARCALSRGKRFVTANKELIASSAPELAVLAQQTDATLDFGAAVGGSAPVISLLRDLLGTTTPDAVRGILNGTSNYILTLVERGASFQEALERARCAGFAEADCSRDLDGRDAAAKLTIVAWLSFGIAPSELNIRRIGITPSIDRLVTHAAKVGGKVRVIAECISLGDRRVAATVEPVLVSAGSAFARTEFEDNRVEVDLGWSAPIAVSGPGAGGHPTATALLSDLLHSSLPSSHRASRRNAFVSADDSREHEWLIVDDDRSSQVRGTRASIHDRLSAMEALGLAPSAARIELGQS